METTAKLIAVYVDTHGPVTVHELSDELDLPLLIVIAVVNRLRESGWVTRDVNEVRSA